MPATLEQIRYEHGHRGVPPIALPFHIVTLGGDIQAAITAAAADGRHIWIHPGTYVLPATLTVPAAASIYIWGCGQDTIIQCPLGVIRMFDIAGGFAEFGLFNITLDIGLVGHVDRMIWITGPGTGHLYFCNVVVTGTYNPVNVRRFVFAQPPGSLDYVLIDHCTIIGALLFRDLVRGDIRDSWLDGESMDHNFTHSTIYSARNIWESSAVLGTVRLTGTGLFHDDGSRYIGNVCIATSMDEVNLRGCHLLGGTQGVGINAGEVRIADSYIYGAQYAVIQTTVGAYNVGIKNCDLLAGPGPTYSVQITDGYAEIVGNNFVNSGIRVGPAGRCLLGSNNITATNAPGAVFIEADNCNVTDNRILFSAWVGTEGIWVSGSHNTVTGNMLHNYIVRDAGAGNVIQGNRVGA